MVCRTVTGSDNHKYVPKRKERQQQMKLHGEIFAECSFTREGFVGLRALLTCRGLAARTFVSLSTQKTLSLELERQLFSMLAPCE